YGRRCPAANLRRTPRGRKARGVERRRIPARHDAQTCESTGRRPAVARRSTHLATALYGNGRAARFLARARKEEAARARLPHGRWRLPFEARPCRYVHEKASLRPLPSRRRNIWVGCGAHGRSVGYASSVFRGRENENG